MPINKVARAAIEELRSRFGVNDLTPDEVLELNDLGAAQLAAGNARDHETRLPAPVQVGNVLLHPMTCAAQDFYERFQNTPMKEHLRVLLIPWVMSNARTPGAFDEIKTSSDLRSALRRFRRRAGASPSELDEAAADILAVGNASPESEANALDNALAVCDWVCSWNRGIGEPLRELCKERIEQERAKKDADNPRGAFRWRKLAAELGALTGVSPDYWYSNEHVLALIAFRRVWERERNSGALAAYADSEKGDLVEAIKNLRLAMKRIVDSRAAQRKEQHV